MLINIHLLYTRINSQSSVVRYHGNSSKGYHGNSKSTIIVYVTSKLQEVELIKVCMHDKKKPVKYFVPNDILKCTL